MNGPEADYASESQRVNMEIREPVPFPPDQEGGQHIRADLVNSGAVLIFDWQEIDYGDRIGDAKQEK